MRTRIGTPRSFAILGLSAALIVSLVLVTRPARADVIINEDCPIEFCVWNPCTCEYVQFCGVIHLVIRVTEDGAGGCHLGVHENFHDVEGVGCTSGECYSGSGTLNGTLNLTNGVDEGTLTANVRLTGPSDKFIAHLVLHFTYHPDDCSVSSCVDKCTITCR